MSMYPSFEGGGDPDEYRRRVLAQAQAARARRNPQQAGPGPTIDPGAPGQFQETPEQRVARLKAQAMASMTPEQRAIAQGGSTQQPSYFEKVGQNLQREFAPEELAGVVGKAALTLGPGLIAQGARVAPAVAGAVAGAVPAAQRLIQQAQARAGQALQNVTSRASTVPTNPAGAAKATVGNIGRGAQNTARTGRDVFIDAGNTLRGAVTQQPGSLIGPAAADFLTPGGVLDAGDARDRVIAAARGAFGDPGTATTEPETTIVGGPGTIIGAAIEDQNRQRAEAEREQSIVGGGTTVASPEDPRATLPGSGGTTTTGGTRRPPVVPDEQDNRSIIGGETDEDDGRSRDPNDIVIPGDPRYGRGPVGGGDETVRGGPFIEDTGAQGAQGGQEQGQGQQGQGVPDTQRTGNPIDDLTRQMVDDLGSIRNEIRSSKAPDIQAIFMSQAQSLIDMLNKQESDLRARNEQQGSEIDPATQFTIDQLRERLTEDLKATQEDLNRRGLFHSGILLEIEQKLRTGATSEEGRILAERLNRMQEQLNERLSNIDDRRFGVASQYGLAGIQGQVEGERDERNRRDDLMRQVMGIQGDLRGQLSGEREGGRGRALQERIAAQNRAESQRQFDESFGMEKAKFNIEQTYQQQQDARELALERERLAIQAARPTSGGSGNVGTSSAATRDAIASISGYPDMESASADLAAKTPGLIAIGVDINAVSNAIYQYFQGR